MQSIVIGSSERADYRITDGFVSRLHCQISEHGSGYLITDLGSKNGTYVGTDKVKVEPHQSVPIQHGARIQLTGQHVLVDWGEIDRRFQRMKATAPEQAARVLEAEQQAHVAADVQSAPETAPFPFGQGYYAVQQYSDILPRAAAFFADSVTLLILILPITLIFALVAFRSVDVATILMMMIFPIPMLLNFIDGGTGSYSGQMISLMGEKLLLMTFYYIIVVIIRWLYFSMFESSKLRATPGKRMMNLFVCSQRGEQITFINASGRFFSKWISDLTLGIGYILAAITDRKQALHDLLAKTFVISQKNYIIQSIDSSGKQFELKVPTMVLR